MFRAEVVIKHAEKRRSPRSPVDMPAHFTSGESWRSVCKVGDISCHGARLETYSALPQGAIIWIQLPAHPARRAEVVWSNDFTAACKFDDPLDAASVMAIVRRYGHEVIPDRPIEDMVLVA
jgi:hypothetical protein